MGYSRNWNTALLVGLLALLLTAGAASSLPQEPQPQSEPRITANVEVVNVDVSVTDARGRFVSGLKRGNFRILDEGAEQRITNFSPIEAPATILMLVETGPAVFLIHRQHLIGAWTLLQGLAADDQVALVGYDQSPRMLVPLTADKRAVAEALGGLSYNLGATELRFYDAVAAALDWLAPIPGKKTIVLLSTGLDTSGGARWGALQERLRRSDVTIFPVALGGELRDYDARSAPAEAEGTAGQELSFEEANQALKTMAELTGGTAWFPRRAEEFEGIYRELATQLRNRYSLGFEPQTRDGKFHRIFVQIVDDKGRVLGPWYEELEPQTQDHKPGKRSLSPKRVRYRLFFRRGYVAPAQ